jgi:uncharacterized membrane protein
MADDQQDAQTPPLRPASPPPSGAQPSPITRVEVERRHSGPLPPPEQLRAYDEIIEGAAREIWEDYRDRVRHRQELERRDQEMAQQALSANILFGQRAQWLAFAGVIFLALLAFVLVLLGHDTVGMVVFGTTIAGYVAAFIAGHVRGQRASQRGTARSCPSALMQ